MKTSTKLHFLLAFSLAGNIALAQVQSTKVVDTPDGTVISNIGGTDIPYSASILDIRSNNKGVLFPRMSTSGRDAIAAPQAGLLIYNNTTNQFNYHNGSSWQVASLGNQWGVNGSTLYHTGSVGVGTSAMTNTNTFLTVRGNLGGTNLEGMYVDASSNTGKAFYGYSINDSTRAYHYFDGSTSKWNLAIGGIDRITVNSSGYVGIGTSTPSYRLHVNGSSYLGGYTYIGDILEVNNYIYSYENIYAGGKIDAGTDADIARDAIIGRNLSVTGTSTLTGTVAASGSLTVGNNIVVGNTATIQQNIAVNGTGAVGGTLTVNNNKGVAYNASSSTNLKIYKFTTANFHAILGPHGSNVTAIAFNGGFTSTPHVMVADIASSGGTVGELDRVILILSGCNTSSGTTTCDAKIINTDSASVDYNITWNCIAIGN